MGLAVVAASWRARMAWTPKARNAMSKMAPNNDKAIVVLNPALLLVPIGSPVAVTVME